MTFFTHTSDPDNGSSALSLGSPGGTSGKESTHQYRRLKRLKSCRLGRSPRGGCGNPLHYSCLENPIDRGAWWATVRGVAKSQTQLKQLSTQACCLFTTSQLHPLLIPHLCQGLFLRHKSHHSAHHSSQKHSNALLWLQNKGHAGFPGGSDGKASACNARDPGSIPGLGRSPGEGNGNPLQYSCLKNSMD